MRYLAFFLLLTGCSTTKQFSIDDYECLCIDDSGSEYSKGFLYKHSENTCSTHYGKSLFEGNPYH